MRSTSTAVALLACATTIGMSACGGGESVPASTQEASDESKPSGPWSFVEEAVKRGVDWTHRPSRTTKKLMPEILGSGVAVTDFNRDGAPDIFLVGGGTLGTSERGASAKDRIFLNDGSGAFTDATDAWGLESSGYGMGVAVGDYDGDGWVDVFLTGHDGSERLLRNTGSSFEDRTAASGITSAKTWSTSAGFFDADGDGDLDIYVARYVEYPVKSALKCFHNERHIYCSPALFEAMPDKLLRNNGDGTFTDVSVESGVAAHPGKGLAITIGDVDWDGDQDVFVANDITRNLLFLSDGGGSFEEVGRTAGIAYDETGRAAAGMGADLSDPDRNGMQDIVCTNFQGETSNIYLQKPAKVFRDRSYSLGVGNSGQQRLSFGVDFFDLDNDGDEDLFVANGHIDDGIGAASDTITFAQQNSLFVLEDDGRFRDISDLAGESLGMVEVSRGTATADLDGDRRLDLVVTNNAGPVRILLNRTETSSDAVVLWLEGKAPNRSAIGARVDGRTEEGTIRREILGASSYLSQNDFRVHLGLGGAASFEQIAILWPDGTEQVVKELAAGFYHIVQGSAPAAFTPGAAVLGP